MKKSHVIFSLFLFGLITTLAFKNAPQESLLLKNILAKLLVYNQKEGPEKTYLHTDKDFYTNGETIWFKTYLIDGITHTQSDKSKVVYVELVNSRDSVVEHRRLYVDALGASGDIQIRKDIPQGNYHLRAYTKYMLNEKEPVIFQKKIPIVVQRVRPNADLEDYMGTNLRNGDSKKTNAATTPFGAPKVRFFPEGGNLVEGLSTVLGIEVVDAKGNGIALKGFIKDDKGKTIKPFESFDFGLGKVNFKPEPNTSYHASIDLNGQEMKFDLPPANQKGYGLSIKNRGEDMILQVSGNTEKGVEGTLLIGHLRGKLILKRIGQSKDERAYGVKIFNKELLDGVAQFTLFAPDGEPVCERLVFVDNPHNDTQLSIASNADSYGFREKVDLDMLLTDTEGTPLGGDFSLGVVTKNNRLADNSKNTDIRSWLLLDSDLGASVPDAGFFFEVDSEEKRFLLDALMLTHGWRRFVWTDMLGKKTNKTLEHRPEKGIMITGKTTRPNHEFSPKKTMASLTLFGEDLLYGEQETNEQGQFSFGPYIFADSVSGIVQAVDSLAKRKFRQKEVSIFLDSPWPQVNVKDSERKKTGRETIAFNNEYLKESHRKKVTDFKYDPKITQLDEVVVVDEKLTREKIINQATGASITNGLFSSRLYTDSIAGGSTMSAMDLVQRTAGVQVFGQYPGQSAVIRGIGSANAGNGPLYLIDGIATDIEVVQTMRANEVMFVDVVKGWSDTALWGARGSNGVIAFYSNRGFSFEDKEIEVPGITNFEIPGFYKTREFYTPNYTNSKKEYEKPDYRTTLFWEPDVKIDNSGRASVDFFTGDSPGTYIVKVEGVTQDGRPVSNIQTIEIKESN